MFWLFWPGGMWILAPDQGMKLHPLHWKVNSLPLDHQGSPSNIIFKCLWDKSQSFKTHEAKLIKLKGKK